MSKARYEKMFEAWLELQGPYDDVETFGRFKARCDAGEVEGFDVYEDPTIDGDHQYLEDERAGMGEY